MAKFEKSNHTQVPNDFFDEMKHLKGSEIQVFLSICRKTRGWHKDTDSISISQIQEMTALSHTSVIQASKSLEEKGLIYTDRNSGRSTVYEIAYQKSLEVENHQPLKKVESTPKKSLEVTSKKSLDTKETVKETIKKKGAREQIEKILKGISPPAALQKLYEVDGFAEAYLDYRVYLKESYNRWPHGIEVLADLKVLENLMVNGHPPVEVIQQTIHGKNKSFYPLRDFEKKKKPSANDWDQQHLKNPAYQEI